MGTSKLTLHPFSNRTTSTFGEASYAPVPEYTINYVPEPSAGLGLVALAAARVSTP